MNEFQKSYILIFTSLLSIILLACSLRLMNDVNVLNQKVDKLIEYQQSTQVPDDLTLAVSGEITIAGLDEVVVTEEDKVVEEKPVKKTVKKEVKEEKVEEVKEEKKVAKKTTKKEETKEEKPAKKTTKKAEVKEEKKETKKEHKDKKEGYFSKVRREMRKVVWPTFGEVVKYSLAVILFCLVLCLFFLGINAIASLVKGLFS